MLKLLYIHFPRQSVHLIINASVTMVIKGNYGQTCISLCREISPLFNHVKYYRNSDIVLAKIT